MPKGFLAGIVFVFVLLLLKGGVAFGEVYPNASVNRMELQLGESIILTQAGETPSGFGWTENVIWRPDGRYEVLSGTSLGSINYTPTSGPGLYSYQFRLVDVNHDYADQWLTFIVSADAKAQPIAMASAATQVGYFGNAFNIRQDGATKYGLAWTENVMWCPDGFIDNLGNRGYGNISYVPLHGAGTYWYQYRVVDAARQYVDQWIPIDIRPGRIPAVFDRNGTEYPAPHMSEAERAAHGDYSNVDMSSWTNGDMIHYFQVFNAIGEEDRYNNISYQAAFDPELRGRIPLEARADNIPYRDAVWLFGPAVDGLDRITLNRLTGEVLELKDRGVKIDRSIEIIIIGPTRVLEYIATSDHPIPAEITGDLPELTVQDITNNYVAQVMLRFAQDRQLSPEVQNQLRVLGEGADLIDTSFLILSTVLDPQLAAGLGAFLGKMQRAVTATEAAVRLQQFTVPGGGLVAHEGPRGVGGHTIANHVGKTIEQLFARRLTDSSVRSLASSFFNEGVAEFAVGKTMRRNQPLIENWLLSATQKDLKLVDVMPFNVGFMVSDTSAVLLGTGVRVILRKDTSRALGYFILTAFPEMLP